MTALGSAPDIIADDIASEGWALNAPQSTGATIECGQPGGFGSLDFLLQPLYDLLREVTSEPAVIYESSLTWETHCGEVQEASDALKALCQEIDTSQQGGFAEQIVESVGEIAEDLHSHAHWIKVGSQALQVIMRILQILHSLVCEALRILESTASFVGEILFGSWPWEFGKKAQALDDFIDEVSSMIASLQDPLERALQCFRDLIRLLTDLYRAIVPMHEEIEAVIGRLINKLPGSEPPQVPPGTAEGPFGDVYNPGHTPFDGSELQFEETYDRGYHHVYDLGPTDMTEEELMAMFKENFGHVFVPSRVADNTQLNSQLEHEGQDVETSLFGIEIPGVTSGGIEVQQIADDGFVIRAAPDHPEHPGEVAFRITRDASGNARFEVAATYDQTILDKHDLGLLDESNAIFAFITDNTVWSDMSYRLEDMIRYGGN